MALDPVRFGGGTTTAEALWLGAPVVTQRSDRLGGAVGESILATTGLPELAAGDGDGNMRTVLALVDDRPRRDEPHRS